MELESMIVVHDLSFKPYIDEETIQTRIEEIGREINQRYQGQIPLILGILNGSFIFAADLIRTFEIQSEMSFVKLSSYQGTESSGKVTTLIGLELDLEDRHVIIAEDIIDSGKTLYEFLPVLKAMKPASIAIASLLVKPEALEYELPIDFKGFDIPDKFVIGYGLDYNGLGRHLKGIWQLAE